MGFLNNTTVTVDAILTKKGRELLAQGTEAFNITKFALADDEVNYKLFDVTHPNGTDFYGKVIENMPLLEAIPDENHVMRYKLVTLPKSTQVMPIIGVSPASISFPAGGGGINNTGVEVIASTDKATDNSYTFILHNKSVVSINVSTGAGDSAPGATTPFFLGDDDVDNSATLVAKSVLIESITLNTAKSTQLTVIGNDTGATSTITITNNLTIASVQTNTAGAAGG